MITLHEVMVQPIRHNNQFLADRFSFFLKNSDQLDLVSISDEIAETAAGLRGRYLFLKMADDLQVAAALSVGADLFLTNDKQLKQLTEIPMAVLDEYCH